MKFSIWFESNETQKILIEDLLMTKEEIASAVSNLYRGMPSQTAGPLSVMLHESINKYQLTNGYHRVVEFLMQGKNAVAIKNSGIANWAVPSKDKIFYPDFDKKYFGMEEFIEYYELRNL